MKRWIPDGLAVMATLIAAFVGFPGGALHAQEILEEGEALPPEPSVEARIWLDRGADPVVNRGDRVRVYYRTSVGAYVSIFHVDTNGAVSLVFPQTPDSRYWVEGGRDFRLLFPPEASWFVEDDPGVGYFFILASPEPMDFSAFPYSWQSRGWDLSAVGRSVYDDPFVAMDDYIAQLIPDWEYADYTLDWVEYNVGDRHEYPRFLCYDCHGFTPYSSWNPYLSACTSFRVVIYDDPWYYPVNRYRGRQVVYVRPQIWRQPRYAFRNRLPNEPWAPLVQPRPTVVDRPGVPGSPAVRRSDAGIGSGGTAYVYPNPRRSSGAAERPRPTTRVPTRGKASPSVQTRPSRSGVPGVRSGTRPGTEGRPGVDRRPSSRSGGTTTVTPRRTRPSGAATRGGNVIPRSGSASPGSRGKVQVVPRGGSGGGSIRAAPGRSGPARAIPGSSRGGSSAPPIRRPPARSGSGSVRAPTRSRGGSVGRTRPPARSSGGAVRRAPSRSGGASAGRTRSPARPPARASSGNRSRGSSAGRSAPPRRSPPARRAPPRRRGGGGGGSGV